MYLLAADDVDAGWPRAHAVAGATFLTRLRTTAAPAADLRDRNYHNAVGMDRIAEHTPHAQRLLSTREDQLRIHEQLLLDASMQDRRACVDSSSTEAVDSNAATN
jgi:hypothetical protein